MLSHLGIVHEAEDEDKAPLSPHLSEEHDLERTSDTLFEAQNSDDNERCTKGHTCDCHEIFSEVNGAV